MYTMCDYNNERGMDHVKIMVHFADDPMIESSNEMCSEVHLQLVDPDHPRTSPIDESAESAF